MSNKIVPLADLDCHPAIAAWRTLEPDRPMPEQIVPLKGSCLNRHDKKSAVYRLSLAGSDGYSIIAKRCLARTAATERTIYTEVLPLLPCPALEFYGSVDEAESTHCWLFLEDAGEVEYRRKVQQHRQIAANWLALLHGCSARRNLAEKLPGSGPEHYFGRLHACLDTLRLVLSQPELSNDERRCLELVLRQCEGAGTRWDRIVEFCDDMPRTVVHGDFVSKNVRIRSLADGPALFAFDWEHAGWGLPAADLTRVDPDAYQVAARRFWPRIAPLHVELLATIGMIFRLISAMDWTCDSLSRIQSSSGLEKPLCVLRKYKLGLRQALRRFDRRDPSTPPMRVRYPDAPSLLAGLSSALRDRGITRGPVKLLGRQPNPGESSFPSEQITCLLEDGGTKLHLLCKYGTEYLGYSYGHKGGVAYEAKVYRDLLEPMGITVPRFMGAYSEPASGATWLALEYLDGCIMASKQPLSMQRAARWIGKFHAAAAERLARHPLTFLNQYDSDYYRGWIVRTSRFAALVDREMPWLQALCERRESIIERFMEISKTVIHGEFYTKNILVQDGVIHPVDWESPAVAFGEIDLAALVEGSWPKETVQSCKSEYLKARWPDGTPADFDSRLDAAALYLQFRWLGDHPKRTRSVEGRQRLDAIHDVAGRLGLI